MLLLVLVPQVLERLVRQGPYLLRTSSSPSVADIQLLVTFLSTVFNLRHRITVDEQWLDTCHSLLDLAEDQLEGEVYQSGASYLAMLRDCHGHRPARWNKAS